MNTPTVILQLKGQISAEDYKQLYFTLRRQISSGVLLLPPDIEFLGVTDNKSELLLIQKDEDDGK